MTIKKEIMAVSTKAVVVGTERRERTLRKQELWYLVSRSEKEESGRCLTLSGRKKME